MYDDTPAPPTLPTPPGARRDSRGRLLAGGPSLNPRGRPRSGLALAEMIREVAGEPTTMRELVRLVLEVAFGRAVELDGEWVRACAEARRRGEPPPARPARVETIQPNIAEMQRAWDWLATWGFQKPTQVLEISGPDGEAPPLDYSRLSLAELAQLEATLRKAAGLEPAEGPPPLPGAAT